jgi:5-hydroxyisourate hydrolase
VPGISIHVMDVSRGIVVTGMLVEVHSVDSDGMPALIIRGLIGANELLDGLELSRTFNAGGYAALFHVADYYRDAGINLPAVPFLDVVHFHFGIAEPVQHYHLPMKVTPWGYSCFRGGA